MNRLLESLLAVVFPETCPCCGEVLVRGERLMCLRCRLALPLTDFHLSPADNELRSKLNGLVRIERAAAYFHYNRLSPHARLIHDAKYRERPRLARELAAEYARIIAPAGFFDGIEAIVPVPLNFWKECRRGYNQCDYIASGIAQVTGLSIVSALRAGRHSSQTRKDAEGRREAARGVFSSRPGTLDGVGHALLVDDIATTGATLYGCASALADAHPELRISVLTLASTRQL